MQGGRVGIDIGGTFTDFVAWLGSKLMLFKLPSTPALPEEAVVQGLQTLTLQAPFVILHGTTVGTNTVLEGKGACTAFLTTAGFRDLLFLGRQTRRELYSLCPEPPATLVKRALCAEVKERLAADGSVLIPLRTRSLPRLITQWKEAGVESVAICLLFAYRNPQHEHELKRRLQPHFEVSISSEVAPEFREYERASTTFLNAYLAPRMKRSLSDLDSAGKRLGAERLLIAHSNGGLMAVERACAHPVSTLLSGPAAGVMGAWAIGRQAGFDRLITFDMGGTSTDVALIEKVPARTGEGEIAGMPLRLPRLDIHTIGAGGGSLAYLDPAGGLRVGPQSAGADPGPAAYGKGDQPTVTDAHLVLGHLLPELFGFGQVPLYPERAWESLSILGRSVGRKALEVAEAVLEQANVRMARAIRTVSVARGHDPAEFTLLAFGGAGALHLCSLAEEVGIPRWIIPPHPGVLSALGLLWSDLLHEAVRTFLIPLAEATADRLQAPLSALRSEVEQVLRQAGAEPREARCQLYADLRYEGQSYELTVPFDPERPDQAADAFHALHQQHYGYASVEEPIELVAVRLRATWLTPHPTHVSYSPLSLPTPSLPSEARLFLRGREQPVPLFERQALEPGQTLPAPCLIVQPDTTILIEPGWKVQLDFQGNLVGTSRS